MVSIFDANVSARAEKAYLVNLLEGVTVCLIPYEGGGGCPVRSNISNASMLSSRL